MFLQIVLSAFFTFSLGAEVSQCDEFNSCGIFCQNGYKEDKNGCDLCECVDDEFIVCPVLGPDCNKDCDRIKDKNGCPTCDCVPECVPKNCGIVPVTCDFGFEKDEFGCETCKCVPPPICPGDPVPVKCGASCGPVTCKQQLTSVFPSCLACVPSCVCPKPNTFLDTNRKCVPIEDCGCVDSNNNYYQKWSSRYVFIGGRLRRCTCYPGNKIRCRPTQSYYY